MSEPTPRQVLYALVAAGFVFVVSVLIVGAAIAAVAPAWWTVLASAVVVGFAIWGALNWRRTIPLLVGSIALFIVWTIAMLVIA